MYRTKKSLALLLAVIVAAFSFMSVSAAAASEKDVTITKSGDTAKDPDGRDIHYLESMTFTLPAFQKEYILYLYVDSQVMGVQFCDGSGDATSGNPDKLTKYKAVLSVNWDAATVDGDTITPDASLSCYVNAMGGIEFGAKLFDGMTVKKSANGDYIATLHFSDDDTLVIYTVQAHIFVDADKSPVGFYDANGKLHTVNTADAVHTDQNTVPENLKNVGGADVSTNAFLAFFQRIAAFFKRIAETLKNLFH